MKVDHYTITPFGFKVMSKYKVLSKRECGVINKMECSIQYVRTVEASYIRCSIVRLPRVLEPFVLIIINRFQFSSHPYISTSIKIDILCGILPTFSKGINQ